MLVAHSNLNQLITTLAYGSANKVAALGFQEPKGGMPVQHFGPLSIPPVPS